MAFVFSILGLNVDSRPQSDVESATELLDFMISK